MLIRLLSTKAHGTIDYLIGAFLISTPFLVGFSISGWQNGIPMVTGTGIIIYSLCTDYELGINKKVQMKIHLWIDTGCGLFLLLSPWLFNFEDQIFSPHAIIGVVLIILAIITRTAPAYYSNTIVKRIYHMNY